MVFSHHEVAYIKLLSFCNKGIHVHNLVFFYKLLEISLVSFYFTVFVNKVLFFKSCFYFLSSLSSFSFFLALSRLPNTFLRMTTQDMVG